MCFISEIEKWDFKPKTFLFECENWVYSQITINETGLTKSQRKSLRRKRCKRIGRRIDLLIEEIRKSGLTGELLQKAHQLHLIVSNSELEMDEIIERESDAIHKGRFGVGIVVAPLPPDAAYICIWKDC